jgi:hypothetical protein
MFHTEILFRAMLQITISIIMVKLLIKKTENKKMK